MDDAIKQSTHQFHKIFFHISMFSMQCKKNITVEDNKKRMDITNFINITLYIAISYVKKMSENKNDSINSCY